MLTTIRCVLYSIHWVSNCILNGDLCSPPNGSVSVGFVHESLKQTEIHSNASEQWIAWIYLGNYMIRKWLSITGQNADKQVEKVIWIFFWLCFTWRFNVFYLNSFVSKRGSFQSFAIFSLCSKNFGAFLKCFRIISRNAKITYRD